MNKIFKILVCLSIVGCVYATEDESKMPSGCLDVGYFYKLKTLNLAPERLGEPQSLYLFFNQSNNLIMLYQMRTDDSSRTMFLNHPIQGRYWAVLATNEPKLKFICASQNSKSIYGKVVDCSEHIKVCEFTSSKFGLNTRGNYWLVNSSSRNSAVWAIVHYGIIPAK